MAYRHPRIPVSREQQMRAFWARSFRPKGPIDQVLAEGHPNPQRSSCPGLYVLFAAAVRHFPEDHAVFCHRVDCSPCYREYCGIQRTESLAWLYLLRLSRATLGVVNR